MDSIFGTWCRLAPRGGAGLSCDKDGVALGPVVLVAAQKTASGKARYRLRSAEELKKTFALAYGPKPPGTFARWHEGLNRVAEALDQGQAVLAAISAVQLGLPEIAPERMDKLARSSLTKSYNPDEPRVPAGDPTGGEWTGDGEDGKEEDESSNAQGATPSPVSAQVDENKNVVIQYDDGSSEIRSGGTPAWRNNNPGNMLYRDFTRANGAIGRDGRFAIFPDSDTGYQAMIVRLSSPQWNDYTLSDAIHIWAPDSEPGNNPDQYAAFVSRRSGLALDRQLGSMTASEIDSMAQAMKIREGWKPGTIKTISSP
jgi:hypothetical protein